jgi:carbon storage regulator
MLVLTRKRNESVVINDVIKVTIVEIRGDKVRLGIEAPREVGVHRLEIWEQIQRGGIPQPKTADSSPYPPPDPEMTN